MEIWGLTSGPLGLELALRGHIRACERASRLVHNGARCHDFMQRVTKA